MKGEVFMNPIQDNVFGIDYHRYVTQDLFRELPPQGVEPEKKFDLKGANKSDKSKKDGEKSKEKKKQRPFTRE